MVKQIGNRVTLVQLIIFPSSLSILMVNGINICPERICVSLKIYFM